MDYFTCDIPHPYGAKPTGNSFFANEKDLHVRFFGLGKINDVSDEVLMELLSYCDGPTITAMLQSSRALYAYCHFTDLWRDLTLREFNGENIKFINSWKDTYVNTMIRNKQLDLPIAAHVPIAMRGIFSNLLHRSWVCRNCDLSVACPGIFKYDDIQRVSAKDNTTEEFVTRFEVPNIPVVITDGVKDWAAFSKWTNDYITKACGNTKMRATSAAAPIPCNFTAHEYFTYSTQTTEEAPLYLFERNFAYIAPEIGTDYSVPDYFANNASHGTDLFRVFGEKQRPDYRWLIAGPARSGSIFHIDPNQTNAWNVCIRGRKKWIFYPPGISPPGVKSSPDGAEVAVPISTGEWLLSFWRYHLEARKHPDPASRPLEVVLNPGEIMFVPHGYWHMVLNLDDCIALTHNYVSTSNLADVLRFLRDTPDQISGVRDRKESGTVQPEEMYTEFVKRLETEKVLSQETIERYIADSMKPSQLQLQNGENSGPIRLKTSGTVGIKKKKTNKTGVFCSAAAAAAAAAAESGSTGCNTTTTAEDAALPVVESFSFGFAF